MEEVTVLCLSLSCNDRTLELESVRWISRILVKISSPNASLESVLRKLSLPFDCRSVKVTSPAWLSPVVGGRAVGDSTGLGNGLL